MPEYVWGVDLAVAHLEFAFADMTSDHVEAESLMTKTDVREGERLASIYRQVQIYVGQTKGVYPPHVVFVEQPSGRFPSPQLSYVAGVVQAAIFDALSIVRVREREIVGTPVWTIPSGKWKLVTVGRGNATKEQVAGWVTSQRHKFDGQDQADAICVAIAGRRMLQEDRWEIAA